MTRLVALLLGLAYPAMAMAQDLTVSGLLDFRLVAPSGQISNFDGGFGKFRWGEGRGSPIVPDLAGAVFRASAAPAPDIRLYAEFRYDPRQKTAIDLLDAYVRYRPVSTSRWRWSVKAGAFFPPVSLENTNIGWTPEWTLTSSAINSWIGEEIRIIGSEGMLEWRGEIDRFEFVASVYGLNETAGAAISAHGWTFADKPVGLFDHVRLVNINGRAGRALYSDEFRHYDHSIGWYAGVAWERTDLGRLALLLYDNEGDPKAHDQSQFGWRTQFASLGVSTELGPVVVLSQALVGTTAIEPMAGFVSKTVFWSYYVLAGIERGAWRLAVRFDQFATREANPDNPSKGDERGIAGTMALTYTPYKGVRLVGEVMVVDSTRSQRVLFNKTPHATEVQAQLAMRFTF
jgi:hypothetical protein